MSYRDSLFDKDWVNMLVFGGAIALVWAVVAAARTEFHSTTALLIGAVCVVPAFLATFFIAYQFDRSRGPRLTTSTHGVTLSGVLFAEAVILGGVPLIILDGHRWDWEVVAPTWLLAVAFLWGSRHAKKVRRARMDMARLAEFNVNLATRFMVRPDTKGWPEIDPFTVLAYQRIFERALKALGEPLPRIRSTSEDQARRLINELEQVSSLNLQRREDAGLLDYGPSYYPGTVLALVLIYLDSLADEREKERSEWAAVIATRRDAPQLRDGVQGIVQNWFDKYATRYK